MLVWAWLFGVGLLLCQGWGKGGGASLQAENVWQFADRNCTSPTGNLCAMLNGICQHGRCVSQNCTFQCVCHEGYQGRECNTAVVKQLDPIGDLGSLNHLELLLQDTTSTTSTLAPAGQAASPSTTVASTASPPSPLLPSSTAASPPGPATASHTASGGGSATTVGRVSFATSAADAAANDGGPILTAPGGSGGASVAMPAIDSAPASDRGGNDVASPVIGDDAITSRPDPAAVRTDGPGLSTEVPDSVAVAAGSTEAAPSPLAPDIAAASGSLPDSLPVTLTESATSTTVIGAATPSLPLAQSAVRRADPSLSLLSALMTTTFGASANPSPSAAQQPLVGVSPSWGLPQPSLPDFLASLEHQSSPSVPFQILTTVVTSATNNPRDEFSLRGGDVPAGPVTLSDKSHHSRGTVRPSVPAGSVDNTTPSPDQPNKRKDDMDDGGPATTDSSQQRVVLDWMSSGGDSSGEDGKERLNATDDSMENKTAPAAAPLTPRDDNVSASTNSSQKDSKQDSSSEELNSTSAENSTETVQAVTDKFIVDAKLRNSSHVSEGRSDDSSRRLQGRANPTSRFPPPTDGGVKRDDERPATGNTAHVFNPSAFSLLSSGPSRGDDDSAVAFPTRPLLPPSHDPFSRGGLSPLGMGTGLFPSVPSSPFLIRNTNSATRLPFGRMSPGNLGLVKLDVQLRELLRGGVHQPFPSDAMASRLPGARSSSMRIMTKRLQDIKQPFFLTMRRGQLFPRPRFRDTSDRFAQTEDSGDGATRLQEGEAPGSLPDSTVRLTGTQGLPMDAGQLRRNRMLTPAMAAALSAARHPPPPQLPAAENSSSLPADNGGSKRLSDNGHVSASSGSNSNSDGDSRSTRKRSSLTDAGLTRTEHRSGSSLLHSQASPLSWQGPSRDVSLSTLLRLSALWDGGTDRVASLFGDRRPVTR